LPQIAAKYRIKVGYSLQSGNSLIALSPARSLSFGAGSRLQRPGVRLAARPSLVQDSREMREFRREVEIDASPERVWAVLTDFAAYPEWNPFIRSISGELREGAKLEVSIKPPGARATTFKPTVRAVVPGRELRWLGRVFPGLFDGEHSLRIEPLDGGRSRFVQSERFSGLLVGLAKGTLAKTEVGFEQMNAALKTRVEQASAQS
jgi:hypothetical protein